MVFIGSNNGICLVADIGRQNGPYCFPCEVSSADELCNDAIQRVIQLLQGWILDGGWLTFCSTIFRAYCLG